MSNYLLREAENTLYYYLLCFHCFVANFEQVIEHDGYRVEISDI